MFYNIVVKYYLKICVYSHIHILKTEIYRTVYSHLFKIGRLWVTLKNFSTINLFPKKEYASFKKGNIGNKFF